LPAVVGVKEAPGETTPSLETVALPTEVPPVQLVGALDCAKTENVAVPVGALPPLIDAVTLDAEIEVPTVPFEGALTTIDGVAAETTVSVMPGPHVEVADAFVESPL
jgi:hypothetical protein